MEAGFATGAFSAVAAIGAANSQSRPLFSNGDYAIDSDGNILQATQALSLILQLVINNLEHISKSNPTLPGLQRAVQTILKPYVPEVMTDLVVQTQWSSVTGRAELSITARDAETSRIVSI